MHDLKWIREHSEAFDQGLATRGIDPLSQRILALDESHRAAVSEMQDLQTQRNSLAKDIGTAKASGQDATALLEKSNFIKVRLPELEHHEKALKDELHGLLMSIPSIPYHEVPVGADETFNQEIRRFGTPRTFDFTPLPHYELGEALGEMDFERAAKMSGSRFVILRNQLAKLERALANFMLDVHTTEFGYQEISPPTLVRSNALYGTGQLPKFEDDQFKTTSGYYLIATSEIPLTNMMMDEIIPTDQLPLRFTAHTPCYRQEAGSAGRDTRGMIRVHQFSKVELVSITTSDQSSHEHERMVSCAETILQRLELPYRTMLLSTGDMGFSAKKTYDLEVWLPSQDAYREISSCSNCADFQARRMNARYRDDTGHLHFAHTLNGSGLAVGRTLVAVLENYQQKDGSIMVPEVLRPFMNTDIIEPVR
ncbi:serine--tRNA ligase [Candidatus Bodocaedibacter vickermanii]|uniref:Serine--tRNA ligase n=1 Tax=Candidatus Bodocaedibacter vickermanii TaxID=2741701 RepID=A0A7L9RSQ6_9PROT|nr:Serine--tRNA ligase [Candidatus Paracaedibacteraceae bacterium 'Lake Konstanz']